MTDLVWLECGGSRCQGLFAEKSGKVLIFDIDKGYNATTDDEQHLKTVTSVCMARLRKSSPQQVFMGAAGLTPEKVPVVVKTLSEIWPESHIQVFNDLEALGRAYGKSCIAGILGTGASAALWDGQKLQHVGPALGWIVGDEGSGTWLGKQLVRERFYDLMPASLASLWDEFVGTDSRSIILKKIYGSDGRTWLAGLTRWLVRPEVRKTDWARQLLRTGFDGYFRHQVKPLITSGMSTELVLAGGVAWHFRDEVTEVTQEQGLSLSAIVPSASAILHNLSAEEIYLRLCLGTR